MKMEPKVTYYIFNCEGPSTDILEFTRRWQIRNDTLYVEVKIRGLFFKRTILVDSDDICESVIWPIQECNK